MRARSDSEKRQIGATFFGEPKKCQCGCGQTVPRSEGGYVAITRTTQRWMRNVCAQKRKATQ